MPKIYIDPRNYHTSILRGWWFPQEQVRVGGSIVLKDNDMRKFNPVKTIPGDLRQKLWNQPCAICGNKDRIQIDHIVPKSKGGTSVPKNLQSLCMWCNARKGYRLTNEEFILKLFLYNQMKHNNPKVFIRNFWCNNEEI